MIDIHYNLWSDLYFKSLKKDFIDTDSFSRELNNDKNIITNLYYINPKEVKDELSKN